MKRQSRQTASRSREKLCPPRYEARSQFAQLRFVVESLMSFIVHSDELQDRTVKYEHNLSSVIIVSFLTRRYLTYAADTVLLNKLQNRHLP